ncbi:unnamed protein product [Lactuca virosa]|uniref:AAA+ ATPase domain-containing protein n=1 Tax=Lactuca virosa TaxID=75947 RepID=A0AAU9MBY7_9ASTR|nr:unnamed protein product [Lactuca virosa]
MAMANLLLNPLLTIYAPVYTHGDGKPFVQSPSHFKKSFSYIPPTSSSTLPLSLCLSSKHAAAPISTLLKEHKGFGGNMNCSAFWALSFWDDVVQTDKKCQCASKEESTVSETSYDTRAVKTKFHKTKRSSGAKQSRKIYAIIVGASFCLFVAFSYQNKQNKASYQCRSFLLASNWIRISLWWYELYVNQNIGKIRNRKPSKKQSITFDDVEGVDAAKSELLEIVLCIKGDSNYVKLGAKLPRGVLLAGPPGTGKTLLARAVAGEADVPFFSISGSELVEIYAGAGAARVRDLFWEAKKRSPSIIFIDEIDAVGGQRGTSMNCERDQTLNQLLTEMDGFEKGAKVVVIAATNRPGSLDSALMRPGRFSRKVIVGEPNEVGRRKIFGLYLEEVPMEEDKQVICDLVASRTPGLVGAALENIANESILLAARRGGHCVTKEDVLQAVERATTKIYNDDSATATEAKSPYLFGEMALENVGRYRFQTNYL